MSGKKSKLARKMARLEEATKNTRIIGEIDRQKYLSADLFIPYMLSKFSGKAGYKFVSVGGYGSLFLSEGHSDIVPITLHRQFPETSARKRFNDPDRKDIVVNVIHVYPGFRGFVVDKNANVYIGGISAPATKEEIDALLTFGVAAEGCPEYRWVTAEEFNEALKVEKPLIEKQLQDLETKIKTNVATIDRYTYLRSIVDGMHNDKKLTEEQIKKFDDRCNELLVAGGYVVDNENHKLSRNDGSDINDQEFLTVMTKVMETVCSEFNIEFKLPPIQTEDNAKEQEAEITNPPTVTETVVDGPTETTTNA